MRSKVLDLAIGLGVALSVGQATARPAPGGDLFPPSYHSGSASASSPTPVPAAPGSTRAPALARPPVGPTPRPRMAPPMNARAGRGRLDSFPRAVPAPAPARRPTVAAMLSTGPARSDAIPDYIPPDARGALARLVHRGEPDVPPGLPRGASRHEMIPPEPLVAARGPAEPVDPLLAPPTGRDESARPEPARGELTARGAVDPLLAPRGLPPARDRASALLAKVPPRSEDPLLARKPLEIDRRPAPAEAAPAPSSSPALAGLDPFSPVIPRPGLSAPDFPSDGALTAATSPPEPPRLIARPRPAGGDEPLRRAGTTPDDL